MTGLLLLVPRIEPLDAPQATVLPSLPPHLTTDCTNWLHTFINLTHIQKYIHRLHQIFTHTLIQHIYLISLLVTNSASMPYTYIHPKTNHTQVHMFTTTHTHKCALKSHYKQTNSRPHTPKSAIPGMPK